MLCVAMGFLYCQKGDLRVDTVNLTARLHGDVAISLPSNPTTGYTWEAEFDGNRLRLKEKRFGAETPRRFGSGGEEQFVFAALKAGKTTVVLRYKRPWETCPVEERKYRIAVSP